MSLIVQKYGGSSVADIDRIKKVAKRIISNKKKGNDLIVIVSALGKTTDNLRKLASQINPVSPPEREMDVLTSTGEQISIALLAIAIDSQGFKSISFTGQQAGIITDSIHTKAKIVSITGTNKIKKELKKGNIVIVAGFQGIDEKNDITTLGRGASDLTAVALAASLKADICEIYTDVEGIYTARPQIVKDARKLKSISYEEMMELAGTGAKVMQLRSVEYAKNFGVDIHVRSSFNKRKGTIITKEENILEKTVISGISYTKDEAKISIMDVPDYPGIAAKIFTKIAEKNINIDMIIQNISENKKSDISFTVIDEDFPKALRAVKDIAKKIGAKEVKSDKGIAKVSIIGVGMRSHPGVAAKMFQALAKNKINIEMISTSEIKISCVIRKNLAEKAVRAIHKNFNLKKKKLIK
jgi:aspartate kinase